MPEEEQKAPEGEAKPEEAPAEEPAEESSGEEPAAPNSIEAANKVLEKMDAANKKKEELLDREEQLLTEARLSGRAVAGLQKAPEVDEETQKKHRANEILEGSGMVPWPEDKKEA